MNLISSKIAKHGDVLKLFASIALRTVDLHQLSQYDVTSDCCERLAQTLAVWRARDHFPILPSYLVRNNSVQQPFQIGKKALNAQLVTAGLKRVFYHLKSVDCGRSDLWKSFGFQWKEWAAKFCYLLHMSSGVVSRVSFCNSCHSFLNTQNLFSTLF